MDESLLKALDQGIKERSVAGRSEAIREAVREWLKKRTLEKKIRKEIEGYRKRPIKSDEFSSLLSVQGWPS